MSTVYRRAGRTGASGAVFSFPSPAAAVLVMIDGIIVGRLPVLGKNKTAASFFSATAMRRSRHRTSRFSPSSSQESRCFLKKRRKNFVILGLRQRNRHGPN
jgi:hypothetical protein